MCAEFTLEKQKEIMANGKTKTHQHPGMGAKCRDGDGRDDSYLLEVDNGRNKNGN